MFGILGSMGNKAGRKKKESEEGKKQRGVKIAALHIMKRFAPSLSLPESLPETPSTSHGASCPELRKWSGVSLYPLLQGEHL